MPIKILVPLDGSPVAEAILPAVQRLAAQLSAEVILVQVLPAGGVITSVLERQTYEANAYLKVQVLAFNEQGISARHIIRTGEPAEEIADFAAVNKMDMIAMSTHGRTGLSRALLGSVTEKVVGSSAVPVLLVKAG